MFHICRTAPLPLVSRWYTLLGRGRPRSSEPQRKSEIVTATLRDHPLHLLLKSRVYKRERYQGERPREVRIHEIAGARGTIPPTHHHLKFALLCRLQSPPLPMVPPTDTPYFLKPFERHTDRLSPPLNQLNRTRFFIWRLNELFTTSRRANGVLEGEDFLGSEPSSQLNL